MEVGINVEGGILWTKLMHNSNKQGVEDGKKSKASIKVEGRFFFEGWNFSKSLSVGPTFISKMRVPKLPNKIGNLPKKATFWRLCLV